MASIGRDLAAPPRCRPASKRQAIRGPRREGFMPETVIVVANGDLRLSANRVCWPAQEAAEAAVMNAIRTEGREVRRGHSCDPEKGHGFIDSQKKGMEVFRSIPPEAPLVVV